MNDVLMITFDRDETGKDLTALCVGSKYNGEFTVRNILLGDRAERAYKMLTEVEREEGEPV